jgi:hypothetical protein
VVEDALDPLPAGRAIVAIGQNGGVLERKAALVVVAVGHPAAQLERLQFAAVQPPVEWMVCVVAGLELAQARLELGSRPGRLRVRHRAAMYMVISKP